MASKCWRCKRAVFFIQLWNGGDDPPAGKPLPLDIDPDNVNGTIALTNWPPGFGPHVVNRPRTEKVGRRIYSEAAAKLRRLGGVTYRVHFDTCGKR